MDIDYEISKAILEEDLNRLEFLFRERCIDTDRSLSFAGTEFYGFYMNPMFFASLNGKKKSVKFFLSCGASLKKNSYIDSVQISNFIPILFVKNAKKLSIECKTEIIKMFVDYGYDVKTKNFYGNSIFSFLNEEEKEYIMSNIF